LSSGLAAGGGARTHTILRSLDFESSASANSATPAAKKADEEVTRAKRKLKRFRSNDRARQCQSGSDPGAPKTKQAPRIGDQKSGAICKLRGCSDVCIKHRSKRQALWHKRLYNTKSSDCKLRGGPKISRRIIALRNPSEVARRAPNEPTDSGAKVCAS
jgi:hypothetical protein